MKQFKGFTLIELLVVISILGILTVALLTTFNPFAQLQRGKDAQRKSDLEQLQRALEGYYNDNGKYPCYGVAPNCWGWDPLDGPSAAAQGLANILRNGYIKTIPKDPKSSNTCPGYLYSDFGGEGQKYTIFVKLENDNDVDATREKPAPAAPPPGGYVVGYNFKRYKVSGGACGADTDPYYNYWVNNP